VGCPRRRWLRRPSPASWARRGVSDDPAGIGPIGGLRALLKYAGNHAAIAIAVDMPRVSVELLARLVDAPDAAAIVAPRRRADAPWEPLFARYDPTRVTANVDAAIARGEHSLQRIVVAAGVAELAIVGDELRALDDWDAPDDVDGRR
jgi:molybdopterin-guanine dinucleotide biosynthesis protein A